MEAFGGFCRCRLPRIWCLNERCRLAHDGVWMGMALVAGHPAWSVWLADGAAEACLAIAGH